MKPQRGTRIANKLLCVLCLFVAWQSNVHAQTPKKDPSEALKQLLNLPAPRPPDREQYTVSEYPLTFFDPYNPPPDDAPVSDLVTYWSRWAHRPGTGPSDTVRQRLLEICLDNPALFTTFINLVPQTKAAATKIKEVYDKADLTDVQRVYIKDWLLFNSDFLLDELLAQVKTVKEDEKNGSIENVKVLNAQVGRYNVNDFTFKSLLTVPHISFKSLSMWVDERQRKLYVVYEGQLLRLPLP